MSDLVHRAALFAHRAHAGYLRKFGKGPYIYHPMRVAGRVTLLDDVTEEVIAAAWLHDVVEDTPITLDYIKKEFGPAVERLVYCMTDRASKHLPRAERKLLQRNGLAAAPREVKLIKCCDRLDNLEDMPWDDFRQQYAKESVLLCEAMVEYDKSLAVHPAFIQLSDAANRMAAE